MNLYADFHTHRPREDALVSSREKPERGLWSLEVHPWHLPERFRMPGETFFRDLRRADALGEIGLDRLRGPDITVQIRFLKALLAAAEEAGKPVVVHAVRCDAELDAALRNFSGNVLIHGFRGSERRLLAHLALGRTVSLAPGAWTKYAGLLAGRGLDGIGLESDDTEEEIAPIYLRAERETGISGWAERCRENFRRFIGEGRER